MSAMRRDWLDCVCLLWNKVGWNVNLIKMQKTMRGRYGDNKRINSSQQSQEVEKYVELIADKHTYSTSGKSLEITM